MDTKEKVYEIVKGFSTTMLVTRGRDKGFESRPMQIAKVDEGGDVWFFTSKKGRVVEEINEEPLVLRVFQDERSSYVSLRRRAQVVLDRSRVKELWKEPYKVWFPGGVDDPELTLLAVEPVGAEYWDNRGMNKVSYLFEAAKAYVNGEKPQVGDVGHHAKVSM